MNFTMLQYQAYCETLTKVLNCKDEKKKRELIERLEMIRRGFIPVSFKEEK